MLHVTNGTEQRLLSLLVGGVQSAQQDCVRFGYLFYILPVTGVVQLLCFPYLIGENAKQGDLMNTKIFCFPSIREYWYKTSFLYPDVIKSRCPVHHRCIETNI